MVRHLQRLTQGIHEALDADLLTCKSLAKLQPYQPNLAVTWLFQKSMSVGVNQKLPPDKINEVLSTIFAEMETLGDDVLKPFFTRCCTVSAPSPNDAKNGDSASSTGGEHFTAGGLGLGGELDAALY